MLKMLIKYRNPDSLGHQPRLCSIGNAKPTRNLCQREHKDVQMRLCVSDVTDCLVTFSLQVCLFSGNQNFARNLLIQHCFDSRFCPIVILEQEHCISVKGQCVEICIPQLLQGEVLNFTYTVQRCDNCVCRFKTAAKLTQFTSCEAVVDSGGAVQYYREKFQRGSFKSNFVRVCFPKAVVG